MFESTVPKFIISPKFISFYINYEYDNVLSSTNLDIEYDVLVAKSVILNSNQLLIVFEKNIKTNNVPM